MKTDFTCTTLHYKTEDVATLKTILECNNRRISAALSIAINTLFLSIPKQLRAVFIVEKCEDIISGKPEPEGPEVKEFTFTRHFTS